MLILSRRDVEACLDPAALLEAVSEGLQALSAGAVTAPPRQAVPAEDGALLTMPGRRAGGPFVVKLVGLFAGNASLGLETHQAVIALLNATTGRCLAVMDGEHITALRTAAAAALSVRALARADARVAAIVGSGVQARAHLRMLPLVRDFAEIRIVARDAGAAARLGAPAAAAPGDAGVICLTTSASEPVLRAADVAPGTHVTSVGYAPPGGELDPELAARGSLFVETLQAFSAPPAGCAELAAFDPSSGTELGAVLAARAPGRRSRDEITVYKAMGHIAEDAAAAALVYEHARARGLGQEIDL